MVQSLSLILHDLHVVLLLQEAPRCQLWSCFGGHSYTLTDKLERLLTYLPIIHLVLLRLVLLHQLIEHLFQTI